MHLLSKDELQRLIETSDEPCLSIYVPTRRVGAAIRQGPIGLKNLLAEAEAKLVDYGLRSAEASRFLAPVDALCRDWTFWQYQHYGLAIFVIPGQAYHYSLPFEFAEAVMLGNRFYLKPLLPLLSVDGHFYILALSQNEVRLFQGTRYTVSQVDLIDVPTSLAAWLRFDNPEKQLQYHTSTAPGSDLRGTIYHGHSPGGDRSKEILRDYFRYIAGNLQDLLRRERAPLVLAGVDDLLPLYHESNAYSYLIQEGIIGSPSGLSPEELHYRAWQIVEPYFLEAQHEAVAQYRQLAQTQRASENFAEIVPAAHYGRIEMLFVAVGQQCWGEFDPKTNTLQLHAEPQSGDQDLVDTAAIQTLLKGGQVYAVEPEEMPVDVPLAAVFRYW